MTTNDDGARRDGETGDGGAADAGAASARAADAGAASAGVIDAGAASARAVDTRDTLPSDPPVDVGASAVGTAFGISEVGAAERAASPSATATAFGSLAPEPDTRQTVKPVRTADDREVPPGIRVRFFGNTDVGLVREHNEDNFLIADLSQGAVGTPPNQASEAEVGGLGLVFVVCDGMGGAAAGEVASQMAVDTVREQMAQGEPTTDRDTFARRVVTAVEQAGARIFAAAKSDRSRRGMGTTSTVAGLMDKVLFVGQVGDSRAYILRDGRLSLISKDQSLVNQLIEAGQLTEEEAEGFEHSNIILQALGTTEDVSVDLTFIELRRGDRLMMCSDGLSGMVHAEMIREVLSETADPVMAAARLIEMANNGGGHDNITVVVADFDGLGLQPVDGTPAAYQQYPLPPAPEAQTARSLIPGVVSGGRGRSLRPNREASGEAPAVITDPSPEVPTHPLRWGLVLTVLLVGGVGIAWLAFSGPGGSTRALVPPSNGEDRAPEFTGAVDGGVRAASEPTEVVASPAEVRVRSRLPRAELFIEGDSFGELVEGEPWSVQLEPGLYRFELRVGESVAAQQVVEVTAAGATVEFSDPALPREIEGQNEGATSDAPPGREGTTPSRPTSPTAEAGESPGPVPPAQRLRTPVPPVQAPVQAPAVPVDPGPGQPPGRSPAPRPATDPTAENPFE